MAEKGGDRRVTDAAEAGLRVWVQLLRTGQALVKTVETALKQAGLPGLDWYDVLLELDRADDEGLRPGVLRSRLLIAQYNLSRLIDRMEAAGYVRRRPCPGDRRGQILAITDAGREVQRLIWPVYRRTVEESFAARLSPAEISALGGLLDKLRPPPKGGG